MCDVANWSVQERLVVLAEEHGVRLSLFRPDISLVNFRQWV